MRQNTSPTVYVINFGPYPPIHTREKLLVIHCNIIIIVFVIDCDMQLLYSCWRILYIIHLWLSIWNVITTTTCMFIFFGGGGVKECEKKSSSKKSVFFFERVGVGVDTWRTFRHKQILNRHLLSSEIFKCSVLRY